MELYKEVEPTVSSETEIMFEMLWHCGFIHSGWSSDLNKMGPDMISRSLGPEFGGSIGLMFFLAKVCACGEYVLGLVEAILDVFGLDPGKFLSHYFSFTDLPHQLEGFVGLSDLFHSCGFFHSKTFFLSHSVDQSHIEPHSKLVWGTALTMRLSLSWLAADVFY